MNIFFTLLIFLPLIEITGFIVIGGEIGLGASLLWLIGAGMLGTYILRGQGSIWARVQTGGDDLFVIEGMFDAVSLLLAGILLVFPGFISDLIALPLLAPQIRHLLFKRLQKNPNGFIRRHARFDGQSRHGGQNTRESTVIEAEYTEIDPAQAPKGPRGTHGELPRE